ncbi:decapping nuclease DXO homolog [Anopheles maculipalpis]|uniref:decapping nuclease DXO homolog n=1 Tax=Anopheles maculipalpis TaxID=1496333 RepID=UPI0021593B6A|nr:decapping nuclease DXO homolog [Anopheles maculipalpis]
MYTITTIDPDPRHPARQSKPFPTITKPCLVGFFSLNHDRTYDPSAGQLKYLTLPPEPRTELHLDLNEGFETHHPKPSSTKEEKIDMLLTYIRKTDPKELWTSTENGHRRLKHDFVCFRGLLRLICCTPYDWKTPWIVQAIRYRGTIYLCEKPTPDKLASERNETEQQKRFCYYGFKFEQYILTAQPNVPPDTSAPVMLGEEFCSMFATTLVGQRLLYGAEMDGIVSNKPIAWERLQVEELRHCEFVEVKVKRKELTQRQVDNFYRYKTKNWWCQSFLVNVQRLVVGLRDDEGIVREITDMKLDDIRRESRPFWSPAICMNFCSDFLSEVVRVMGETDNCKRVYQFEYDSRESRRVRYRVLEENDHREAFLPEWYTRYVEEMQPKL